MSVGPSREVSIGPRSPSFRWLRAAESPQRLLPLVLGVFALILPLVASLPTWQLLAGILIVAGVMLTFVFRGQPQYLIGIVAALAWASRPTFQIFDIDIRVEQPVVAMLLVIVLAKHRAAATSIIRRAWPLGVGLGLWLGADIASSLLFAPDSILSLRIVVWLATSVGAGYIVAILAMVTDPDRDLRSVLVVAGVAQVGASLIALGAGLVFGTSWGGYAIEDGVAVFRAFGLAWEPNIFGSGVAIVLLLALDRYVERGRSVDLAALALLALGVGMSLTRAVWIALPIGLAAYVVLLAVTSSGTVRFRPVTSLIAAATLAMGMLLGVGLTASTTGTSEPLVAQLGRYFRSDGSPTATPSGSTPAGETPSASSLPLATAVPVDPSLDVTDSATLSFRLERVVQALDDLRASPIIGMGANSYGQRHLHPGTTDQPDYLAIFPITVLYDAGLVGLGGLGVFAVLFVRVLWRSPQRRDSVPFLASLIVMVVAYVSTDALRFSQSWILMGVALGIALRPRSLQRDAPE